MSDAVQQDFAVHLQPDVATELIDYARQENQQPETIIAEIVRAYMGLNERPFR